MASLPSHQLLVVPALALVFVFAACGDSSNSGADQGAGGCRSHSDCPQQSLLTCVGPDDVYSGVACASDQCNSYDMFCGATEYCTGHCGKCEPMTERCDSSGVSCGANFDCSPTANDRDNHGCARRDCATDTDCDEGACVNGRCQSGMGSCQPPAA